MCLVDDAKVDLDAAVAALQASSASTVLETARYHGVGGFVYKRLISSALFEPIETDLRRMYTDALHGHMRTLYALSRVQSVLERSGAQWAVIKGPVLAELVYREPGLRTYNDLDVIVEPGRFAEVVAELEGSGAKLLDRNWKVIRRELFGELHFVAAAGVLLDLHWNLVTIYRGRTSISTDEILSRRVPVSLAGVPAFSLEQHDQLIHLAVHAALSGGDKLLWMKDIDLAVRSGGLDWDLIAERAQRWRVAAPVGLMLARVAATLETPVPDGLAAKLLGRYYSALVSMVDRMSPWQHALGRVNTPSLLLSRSIGQGPLGAAGWLLRRTVRNLDPREPTASSAFTPRGSPSDREAYFEVVADFERNSADHAILDRRSSQERQQSRPGDH
jgi:hypothetical protein